MTASASGIVTRGLRRTYGDVEAVRGLDLEVAPGEVVGLLGPNGAGKTTALRMLATLLTPSAGEARVAGFDVVAAPLEVKRRVGYLTGDTGLYARLSPVEVLTFFGRLHGMAPNAIAARTRELAELLGIEPFAGRRCGTLSTGQKQRVSIARALLHDPAVLILDEPTSGLDILVARDILRVFREAADQGRAVLLSTHILAEVELICDRAVVIHEGVVRRDGSVDELRATAGAGASLTDAFLALLGDPGPGPDAAAAPEAARADATAGRSSGPGGR